MLQITNHKPARYDLEERTLKFAQNVIEYTEKLSKTTANFETSKQLVRSAGSVGANYIEANESLGKKDFVMKIKTCKREAKESCYWLKLSKPNQPELPAKESLIQESTELMKIFGAIIEKSK
jgi:four helix bundle protein